jgi:hypothetical protein
MFVPTQQTRSQRGCNSVFPRRPIHLPINPRRPIHLPVKITVNSRREQKAQNASVLYLIWSAILHKCRTDKWGNKIIKHIHVALVIHCVSYLLPNHPVALKTSRSRCYTEQARCKEYRYCRYTENYTDNWKKYQITFYFVEEGPGRGSDDIKKECNVKCFNFFFFSVFLIDVIRKKITINLKEMH